MPPPAPAPPAPPTDCMIANRGQNARYNFPLFTCDPTIPSLHAFLNPLGVERSWRGHVGSKWRLLNMSLKKLNSALTLWPKRETLGRVNHCALGAIYLKSEAERNKINKNFSSRAARPPHTHTGWFYLSLCARVCGARRRRSGSLLKFLPLIWDRN